MLWYRYLKFEPTIADSMFYQAMIARSSCPACGTPLAPGCMEGMCPGCLLRAAMGGGSGRNPASIDADAGEEDGLPSIAERLGARIGRYRLLEQIGEGGFGVVWMAEQDEPVHRRVALKIIKPGMDSREVIARFENERQALALMDHPNIASVYDGGATETGLPYFVMELVKGGVPITTYCDAKHLTTRQRLELFIDVCHAVQHAHQKGVIHRDLKPSNILVTVKDDRAVPKVIDFGVAKPTQAQLTQRTLLTLFNQRIGTPDYMSPEQAGLGNLDVDTRSDIYSLGVLLYELLTGRRPFDLEKLRDAACDSILRVIREEEPPKPSTRLSALTDEELHAVAEKRGAEPIKLDRLVRGDLDWIVMKALEKDRSRRYNTANAVARDVEHFLRHEPVSAGPPHPAYRLGKLLHRHQSFFVSLGAILICLIGGMAVSTFALIRAHQALLSVETERQRAELSQTAALAAMADAERQLERAETGESAARKSEDRAVTARGQAEAHRLEAERQKSAAQNAQSEAENQRTRSLEERRMAEEVIGTLQYELQDRFAESGQLALLDGFADRVVSYYDQISVEADSPRTRREKTVAMNFKANVLAVKGQPREAIELYRQALALRLRLAEESPADRQAQSDVAQSCLKIALMMPDSEQAGALLGQGLKIIESLETTGPLTPHQVKVKEDLIQLGRRLRRKTSQRRRRRLCGPPYSLPIRSESHQSRQVMGGTRTEAAPHQRIQAHQ